MWVRCLIPSPGCQSAPAAAALQCCLLTTLDQTVGLGSRESTTSHPRGLTTARRAKGSASRSIYLIAWHLSVGLCDVHLAEAVPVLVAGILTPGMADRLVLIAPGGQASVDAILVGVDEGASEQWRP